MTQPTPCPAASSATPAPGDDLADLERQVRTLHEAGCPRVFQDLSDPAPDERTELNRAILGESHHSCDSGHEMEQM